MVRYVLLIVLTKVNAVAVHPRQANESPDLGQAKLLELQHMFWNRFKYPNNIKEAESVNSTIFSENVGSQPVVS